MARKLKSDKVLFIATLLLVCASVVIVYSASAVLADQRYHQPYLFLTKQGLWTMLGLAMSCRRTSWWTSRTVSVRQSG